MSRLRQLTTIALAIVMAVSCSDDGTVAAGDSPSVNGSLDDRPEPETTDQPQPEPETTDQPQPEPEPTDEPLGAGPYPIADIVIDVDPGDGATRTYRLVCRGDTATFTGETALDAGRACLALDERDVRNRLLTDDHLELGCTQQYGGPQLAHITGSIEDNAVDATINRANGCGIADWGGLLAALLPPVG
ncbi:MAG: hypothetical protein ACO3PD_08240 [Acidimicrobiales bacterium]